jgi:ABC-2 type transport system permease protein
MVLLGAAFVAIGMVASALTENQIIAFLGGFGVLFVLWLIAFPAARIGAPWGDILSYLSIMAHMEDFEKGIIDTTHVIYYLSVIGFSLFLTQRIIESKRWR